MAHAGLDKPARAPSRLKCVSFVMIAPCHKRCPRHADESGSVSVEFALWVPFLVAFLVFIVDVSSLMHIQTVMYDAARDAARQVATGKATTAEAETTARARFASGYGMTASVSSADNFATATLSAPYARLVLAGSGIASALIGDRTLTASVTMLMEQDDEN